MLPRAEQRLLGGVFGDRPSPPVRRLRGPSPRCEALPATRIAHTPSAHSPYRVVLVLFVYVARCTTLPYRQRERAGEECLDWLPGVQ